VAQIRKYYEIIQKQKLRDVQMQAIAVFNAVGTAFGSIKMQSFKEFLGALSMKKKDLHRALDEMKSKGLPIEDK
jgi:hypothetical protein